MTGKETQPTAPPPSRELSALCGADAVTVSSIQGGGEVSVSPSHPSSLGAWHAPAWADTFSITQFSVGHCLQAVSLSPSSDTAPLGSKAPADLSCSLGPRHGCDGYDCAVSPPASLSVSLQQAWLLPRLPLASLL